MRLGPVGFLFAVALGWMAVRTVMLWPATGRAYSRPEIAWQPKMSRPQPSPARIGLSLSKPSLPFAPVSGKGGLRQAQPEPILGRVNPSPNQAVPKSIPLLATDRVTQTGPSFSAPPQPPSPVQTGGDISRFSLSAWTILRGELAPGLATAGQLGGSQAGLRTRYALREDLHLAARVSGPLRSNRGKEAALALDWRPARAPVTLTLERRIGLDRGGRDAFAIGLFGGVDRLQLPLGARLDGYAQAGFVGLKRRDAYIDGAVRIEKPIWNPLAIGAGVWAGAQPGASRLDAGPQIVARFPVASGGLRMGAEWRHRIAGDARPGSGPVLSLGADF